MGTSSVIADPPGYGPKIKYENHKQTAPEADLPILAPEDVVSSGEVSAKSCGVPIR